MENSPVSHEPVRKRYDILTTPLRLKLVKNILAGDPLGQPAAAERGLAEMRGATAILRHAIKDTGHTSVSQFIVDLVLSQPDPILFVRQHRPLASDRVYFDPENLEDRPQGTKTEHKKNPFLTDAQVSQLRAYANFRNRLPTKVEYPRENWVIRWKQSAAFLANPIMEGFLNPDMVKFLEEYTQENDREGARIKLGYSKDKVKHLIKQTNLQLGLTSGRWNKLSLLQLWLEVVALGVVGDMPQPKIAITFPTEAAAPEITQGDEAAL